MYIVWICYTKFCMNKFCFSWINDSFFWTVYCINCFFFVYFFWRTRVDFNYKFYSSRFHDKKMNCLLCNYTADDLDKIEEHYVNYQRINKYNFFFRQLMLNKDALLNIECIRCQKFIATKKYLSQHNFLEHYIDGEKKPAEFKTIDITKDNDIIIYNINFEKHSNEYNFYNSQELVDEFLFNVKSRFKPKNKFF